VKSRPNGDGSNGRRGSVRAILYSLAANIAIAIAKLAGAVFTGSGSLLAEAFHSIADSGNEGLLLLGRSQARAPPSAKHPLGQGRATHFWSFIVALLLFSIGGVASIYEGVGKLRSSENIDSPLVAVAIILFAAVAEAVSLYVALKEINRRRGTRSLWRWFQLHACCGCIGGNICSAGTRKFPPGARRRRSPGMRRPDAIVARD